MRIFLNCRGTAIVIGGSIELPEVSARLALVRGKVVYDLNAIAREPWDTLGPDYGGGARRWTAFTGASAAATRPAAVERLLCHSGAGYPYDLSPRSLD